MVRLTEQDVLVPKTVPYERQDSYRHNFLHATKHTGRLFLFAADHKIEHMNDDFIGDTVATAASEPSHLFAIASRSPLSALVGPLGLIARYAHLAPESNYVIKLNGKTNAHAPNEPALSRFFTSPEQATNFALNSELSVVGLGCTVYIGSPHENSMLTEAANMVYHAHQNGLLAFVWMYPWGSHLSNLQSPHLLAGAAGLANSLGADFVKLHPPVLDRQQRIATHTHPLEEAVLAAGNTGIVLSGGTYIESTLLLDTLYGYIQAGAVGCALGRNIFQRPLDEAIHLAQAIAALVFDNAHPEQIAAYMP